MDGIFVTGIDTGVGKTSISAGILKLFMGSRKACYFKPIQTGTIVGDDTREVKRVTEMSADYFMEPVYRFPDPLSPHSAAKRWGKTIELAPIVKLADDKRKAGTFVIVEGAGGLLVPLNSEELQIELIKQLKLPVLVCAEDRVGAINQTLLTLNELRRQNVEVAGVVLTRSRRNLGNAEAISHFGKVEILAEFDPVEDVRTLVGQVGSHPRLRQLFGATALPQ